MDFTECDTFTFTLVSIDSSITNHKNLISDCISDFNIFLERFNDSTYLF